MDDVRVLEVGDRLDAAASCSGLVFRPYQAFGAPRSM
jgi:hypothetical protein